MRQFFECVDFFIQNTNETIQKIARENGNDEESTEQQNPKEPLLEFVYHLNVSAADECDQYVNERREQTTSS